MSTELETHDHAGLTIRLLGDDDRRAIVELAERDGVAAPSGPLLGAELEGRLIAAIGVDDPSATAVADPFVATASIVKLLRMRSGQLRADRRGRDSRARRWRRPGRLRSRGALAGSPPGGGGRLLRL